MKKQSTYRIISIFAIAAVIVTVGVIALNFKKTPTADSQKLQIVAAENFWGNIASQIGGDKVEVTSIISDPSTDPHLYESNAHDAAALSRADIVINNGLGYDDFMDKLLSVSQNDSRQVLSVDKIVKISGDNPNPHLWYDIPRVGEVADAFEKAMAKKDPVHAKAYETNLATFKNSLQPVLTVLQKIKTNHPNAAVAYTERVPEYLLSAAGLNVKTPAGFSGAIEEGNDPSPADTAAMDALFTEKHVRVLLYNAQATSSVTEHVRDLAKKAGIPVVGVTETLPENEITYQSWQLHQSEALLKALENK
jgi:zinc/manganese transport system substrate-binding protein